MKKATAFQEKTEKKRRITPEALSFSAIYGINTRNEDGMQVAAPIIAEIFGVRDTLGIKRHFANDGRSNAKPRRQIGKNAFGQPKRRKSRRRDLIAVSSAHTAANLQSVFPFFSEKGEREPPRLLDERVCVARRADKGQNARLSEKYAKAAPSGCHRIGRTAVGLCRHEHSLLPHGVKNA